MRFWTKGRRVSMRNDPLFALLIIAALATPALAQDGGQVTGPQASEVAPSRFGGREPDQAYGAYQRGLYITALKLALPRAEAGDKAAQTLVAEIYARGLGVRRDGEQAARWYEAAAEQGVPEAQFQTALMLIDGEFLPRDRTRANDLMKAAADAGNPMAQFNFGQLLINEAGNEADEREALVYFERAARATWRRASAGSNLRPEAATSRRETGWPSSTGQGWASRAIRSRRRHGTCWPSAKGSSIR